ncbi:MAG: MMPL family transporter [Actinomycetota bacterium]
MLSGLADLVLAAPRRILAVCGALVVAAGLYGFDAATTLSPAGYEVIGSESTIALEQLANDFDTGPANLVLLVTTDDPDGITGVAAAADGLALAEQLAAEPDVADVIAYWSTPAPELLALDGSAALIPARIVADEEAIYDRAEALRDELAGPRGVLSVRLGGSAMANLEIVEESERDLIRAELLAIPITTVIMLLVFRSVVAALLPLVVSAVAVTGTAAVLKGLSDVTLVSIFALNLTTALGLGMGVDFSLFTISRWREERAAGASPDEALRTTILRAGRSVLFSGMTTAATLAALLLFDYPLLRSLAYAGFAVVLLATVGALVALPATIAVLGDRVERWQLPGRRSTTTGTAAGTVAVEDGRWYRIARLVMRRPLVTAVAVTGLLLLLGTPFLRAQFAVPDDRALPAEVGSRQVADAIRADFDGRRFGALAAVSIEAIDDATLDAHARAVSLIEGVGAVETATGRYLDGSPVVADADVDVDLDADRFRAGDRAWLSVIPDLEPISIEAEAMVADIRALPSADLFRLGGESARLVDNKAEIGTKLLPVLAWVVVVVGVLLYRSFRSVLVPVKAIVLNLLSLTAAFGAIVWIFQDGRFAGVLGFTPTGLTDAQTPVLILCIAFGLSMDYEVFLLSRIKEEWDRTGDAEHSVAVGLQRTGGIITAAAVLMAVVFLSFATGQVTFIQMVGIGLALAILADAALVRTFLVPAVMAMAGRWNWWAPGGAAPAMTPPETDAAAVPETDRTATPGLVTTGGAQR